MWKETLKETWLTILSPKFPPQCPWSVFEGFFASAFSKSHKKRSRLQKLGPWRSSPNLYLLRVSSNKVCDTFGFWSFPKRGKSVVSCHGCLTPRQQRHCDDLTLMIKKKLQNDLFSRWDGGGGVRAKSSSHRSPSLHQLHHHCRSVHKVIQIIT